MIRWVPIRDCRSAASLSSPAELVRLLIAHGQPVQAADGLQPRRTRRRDGPALPHQATGNYAARGRA